jgi:hypothetical protein
MSVEFNPIILRYDGLDADNHLIDLAQLGTSLQGAAQLLGSAGSIVATGQYARRAEALSVRVLASIPRDGSWEIPAVLMSSMGVISPIFPEIIDYAKERSTKAVTSIVNFVISKVSGQKSDMKAALEVVEKAITEAGQTSRHAIDAVERMAANQKAAVRLIVSPVGETCSQIRIGEIDQGAIIIDKSIRDAIEAPEQIDFGPTSTFDILLSELDLRNRSCKFSLRSIDNEDRRVNGEITDPILLRPRNPYSEALTAQNWISVVGKAQLKDGDIEKLYISDIATPRIQASSS